MNAFISPTGSIQLLTLPFYVELALIIPIGLLFYLAPAYALLDAFAGRALRQAEFTLAERVSLALGFGAALPPLWVELTSAVGLRWSPLLAWVYVGSGAVYVAWRFVRHWRTRARPIAIDTPALMLAILMLVALAGRMWAIRDLPVGLLGDAYHHTMMAQLIAENGGLFKNWLPYADLGTFTYHFGFHANAAMLTWLTSLETPRTVLFAGQWMNTLAVPLAFLLTSRLIKLSQPTQTQFAALAGLIAAALTGFYNLYPGFVVNMGRYTQLTGQNVLAIALVLTIENLKFKMENGKWLPSILNFKFLILNSISLACLFQTHYLVTAFAGMFVGLLVLMALLRAKTWRHQFVVLLVMGGIGLLALLLAAPWLINVSSGFLLRNASGYVAPNDGEEVRQVVAQAAILAPIVPHFLKAPILWLAAAGALIAVRRRAWLLAMPVLWSAALVLIVVPYLLGLPGAGIIDYLTAFSVLYLTLIPLAAYTLGNLKFKIENLKLFPILNFALLVLAAWGSTWQANIVEPERQIYNWADHRAMLWIRQNTPPDARFFVNGFPAYGGSLIAGSDAGWWIPLVTQRKSTLPPLTYGSERGMNNEDLFARVNPLYQQLRGRRLPDTTPVSLDLTTPTALDLLRKAGVTHIYSGAKPFPPPNGADRVNLELLRRHPAFKLLYAEGGAEVYELSSQ
ncbi:MAG: hypothetical protein KIH69_012425 [Anaerolineae bacterium]|nr:hypothetical protein [Anaerolineae bacterium]